MCIPDKKRFSGGALSQCSPTYLVTAPLPTGMINLVGIESSSAVDAKCDWVSLWSLSKRQSYIINHVHPVYLPLTGSISVPRSTRVMETIYSTPKRDC